MHILIDSGSYHCLNVGDVAMLQAGLARLRALWPAASIAVVTNSPHALAWHCPGVTPIPLSGRVAFKSDRWFGRAERRLPRPLRQALGVLHDGIRRRFPALLAAVIAGKRALALRRDGLAALTYIQALKRADLVVATGAGVFTDAFIENASGVLDTLEFAVRRNVPAAAFGQGIGPVTSVALRQRLSDVLPRLTVIGLRERRESVRFLEAIGVDADRLIVTGDEAIEMASRAAGPELGDGVGINVRLAGYAGITTAAIDLIGPAIRRAADRLAAPLVAVPIAHHPDCHDGVAIEQVMRRSDGSTAPIVSLDTPARAIAAVSRCRVVVTGSYHAAVFALAQGIPVVAMAATRYYVDKFSGLAELFGGGCDVVRIGSAETGADLETAIVQAWTDAPSQRPQLLKAAGVQIECARDAYRCLASMVGRDWTDTPPDRATPRSIAARFEI